MTEKYDSRFFKVSVAKSFFALFVFLLISFFLSDEISAAALDGIKLALNVIIPTAFPFMVLSDLASHYFEFEKSILLSRLFERIFKINRSGLTAFFSGIAGGFPIGAKASLDLYGNGKISKCECERLMCFSNVSSPAYTVSAVGIGMLSNFKLGLVLFFTSLVSAVITGCITGINKNISAFSDFIQEQKYDLVKSIKRSAAASVNVIFFISFFSALCAIIEYMPIPETMKFIVIPFIEVGSATSYLSDLYIFPSKFIIGAIAFSLSFSGLSVIMQSLALDGAKDISIKKCLLYKLLQGFISFLIILALPI